jgi:hypothetical protein
MNSFLIQEGNINNNRVISTRSKKTLPISLITGPKTIFKKGKLNNIATSYLESSQKIQKNFHKNKISFKTLELKNNSKSKNSNSSNVYNTFNITLNSSVQRSKSKKSKISNQNKNQKNMVNSFNLKSNINFNSTLNNVNQKNVNHTLIIIDGIDSYNQVKSNTNNNFSKETKKKNSIINMKGIKQIRQNIKKKIENTYIINNNSVGKNNKKNISVKKNILSSHHLEKSSINNEKNSNKKRSKTSFEIGKKVSNTNKIKIDKINNNNGIKRKKMFKRIFEKDKIENMSKKKINIKEKLKSNSSRTKININKLKKENSYKRNYNNFIKNSVNKSTAITTSRTELSINREDNNKKNEENEKITMQYLPYYQNNKNLNILSLIQENNRKLENNFIKSNKRNFSYEKKENSFDNIINVLNPEFLNDKKLNAFDDFDDLNSIVRKIEFEKIKKDSQSIFSVNNNLRYITYCNNFNNNFNNPKNRTIPNKNIQINCFSSRDNISKKSIIKNILKWE